MWELIRTNKRNSILLMAIMASVLLGLGGLIGMYIVGPDGVPLGLGIAAAVWVVMALISFSAGDQILLSASGAKRITHDIHPQLFNVVEEMKIAAGLPMPKIYLIDDPAPNAFATGRKPETASIAVTAGLLAKLNRDELQGVIAHEMSHILHRDILFVTLAGIMLGSIVLLSQVFLRGMWYSSMGGRRRRAGGAGRGGSGQAQAIIAILAILAAILAPIMASILYFAISRKREYLADAAAARLTRYPEGLASALEKISGGAGKMESANKVTAPMYIINPLQSAKRQLAGVGRTHPPTAQRIKILRRMAGGSYNDYARAYSQATGSKEHLLPQAALQDKEPVPKRAPSDQDQPKSQKDQMHQINDLVRMVNGFVFLGCACGLTMKIPPNFKKSQINCPRCKRRHDVKKEGKSKPDNSGAN